MGTVQQSGTAMELGGSIAMELTLLWMHWGLPLLDRRYGMHACPGGHMVMVQNKGVGQVVHQLSNLRGRAEQETHNDYPFETKCIYSTIYSMRMTK